jgi:hypothetical protein
VPVEHNSPAVETATTGVAPANFCNADTTREKSLCGETNATTSDA